MRRSAPELFPAGFDQGYCLHGFGRESLKLSGLKLRKIVLANGASYWLASFIFSSMTGTAESWPTRCCWRRMVFPSGC